MKISRYLMVGMMILWLALAANAQESEALIKTPMTIGIVIFEGVLTSEVTAPVEVFGAPAETGEKSFNVLLIAQDNSLVTSNEGLKLMPDATFQSSPRLDVLIVPSSYNLEASEKSENVIQFVKERGTQADYLASNCAGAFILGEAGLINGRKVVTWVGGGPSLKERFPEALVQDDEANRVVIDGNLITSNGALITYESSLVLLEKLAGKKQRDKVAENLYYTRLTGK